MSVIKVLVSDLWGNRPIRLLITIYVLFAWPATVFLLKIYSVLMLTLGSVSLIYPVLESLVGIVTLGIVLVLPFVLPLFSTLIACLISGKKIGIMEAAMLFAICYFVLLLESFVFDRVFSQHTTPFLLPFPLGYL